MKPPNDLSRNRLNAGPIPETPSDNDANISPHNQGWNVKRLRRFLWIILTFSLYLGLFDQSHFSFNETKFMSLRRLGLRNDLVTQHDDLIRNEFETSTPHRLLQSEEDENPPDCPTDSGGWVQLVPKAAQYFLITMLILFSAFFSGLTLSMMGLDTIGLEIVMSGDDANLSRAAAKILPVRKNGNLLLCTLLLGNVAVNTLLGILMADITGGTVGFISSTCLIVIFGEIIPQALFSRYALQVGEKAVPVVKIIIYLLYVLAKPLAFCLDKLLGHELGTTYSKAEMSKLLEIHVKEGRFNQETGTAMAGALKYQDMKVKDVMTPLENTFMVNVDDKLNFETMAIIFKTGYSRIPVYESTPKNIVGLLFVKDLIFIDPEDETTVKQFIDIFGRQTHVVWSDDKLGDVLGYLKKGHTHMSFVRDINTGDGTKDPVYELRGIVTLEDIIELILGDEILDETDAWMDPQQTERRDTFDWARLRLFDSKIVEETLSEDEVRAVVAHLRGNYKDYFTELSNKQLTKMIASIPVTELPEEEREVGELLPNKLLYEKNTDSNACTLILNGKVVVLAGKDNFRSDVSSWSLLAVGALTDEAFAPDFSAYVSGGPCRCLSISREMFAAAMARSKLETLPKPASPTRNGIESGEGKMLFPLSIESAQPLPEESVHEQRGKLLNEFFTKKSYNGHNLVGGSTSASIEMEPRLDDLDDD